MDVMGKEADPNREKRPLVVTAEMRKAFEDLKEALTTASVLGFPYFAGPKAGQTSPTHKWQASSVRYRKVGK